MAVRDPIDVRSSRQWVGRMRPTRETTLERLRRSSWAAWLAGVLLLFQVALVADHLGASAAAAFGPVVEGEALGLLSLCHGDGSVSLVEDDDGTRVPTSGSPVQPCVLCASMAVAGVSIQVAAPTVDVPPPQIFVVPTFTLVEAKPGRPFLRYGTQRGPPLSPVA